MSCKIHVFWNVRIFSIAAALSLKRLKLKYYNDKASGMCKIKLYLIKLIEISKL